MNDRSKHASCTNALAVAIALSAHLFFGTGCAALAQIDGATTTNLDDQRLDAPRTPPRVPTTQGADLPLLDGAAPEPADACVVSVTPTQSDLDPTDSRETPWKRAPGKKIVVQFENNGATERYWNLLKEGVRIWSERPCFQIEAVTTCAPGANCIQLKQARESSDADTDGEFSGDDNGPFRTGGHITVFTKLMDVATDNGALATIVHEMGHALGLVHRLNKNDVMNDYTSDSTNPKPDQVNFDNLLVIYGTVR